MPISFDNASVFKLTKNLDKKTRREIGHRQSSATINEDSMAVFIRSFDFSPDFA